MINLTVETVYQGKVAIRDKYVAEAIEQNEAIKIIVKGKYMVIPAEEVSHYLFKSKVPFFDKITGGAHFLCYYTWVPKVMEEKPKFRYFQVCPECGKAAFEWKKKPRAGMKINASKVFGGATGLPIECMQCRYPINSSYMTAAYTKEVPLNNPQPQQLTALS